MNEEDKKRIVAIEAVARFVRPGMRVGLGTGTTANYAIAELAERYKGGVLKETRFLATSVGTNHLATRMHIKIEKMSNLLDGTPLDIVIDGADAVDNHLNLIKGGGGALLREKVAAYNCKKMIVIIDESKMIAQFDNNAPAIPLEVLPHAHSMLTNILKNQFRLAGAPIFSEVRARPRGTQSHYYSGAHYITDNGNMIIDVKLDKALQNLESLEHELNHVAGVLENGLFTRCKPFVLVGSSRGLLQLTKEGLKSM